MSRAQAFALRCDVRHCLIFLLSFLISSAKAALQEPLTMVHVYNQVSFGLYARRWVPTKTIHVPSEADFQDYAGMAFSGDRFGIVSQVRLFPLLASNRHLGISEYVVGHRSGMPVAIKMAQCIVCLCIHISRTLHCESGRR